MCPNQKRAIYLINTSLVNVSVSIRPAIATGEGELILYNRKYSTKRPLLAAIASSKHMGFGPNRGYKASQDSLHHRRLPRIASFATCSRMVYLSMDVVMKACV